MKNLLVMFIDVRRPVGVAFWSTLAGAIFAYIGTLPGHEIGLGLALICILGAAISLFIYATNPDNPYIFRSDQEMEDREYKVKKWRD